MGRVTSNKISDFAGDLGHFVDPGISRGTFQPLPDRGSLSAQPKNMNHILISVQHPHLFYPQP